LKKKRKKKTKKEDKKEDKKIKGKDKDKEKDKDEKDKEKKRTQAPLDEDDIALMKTYGLGPYATIIKTIEDDIEKNLKM